ncbi:hypothetical protein GGR58DRAFT_528200 [Xylaria digitata]|nr:hypothetical protein GGR58DRAFT_528200 [Xylaria digitata]
MAHTVQTSRVSPPLADLRPAPLRIPLRKSVASCDDDDDNENGDSRTVVTKDTDGARDTSPSALSRKDPSQHSQSDIPHTHVERPDPGSRLESLVSRFEILDAVNSADTSLPQYPNSSYKATPSTIPRATGSKQIPHQDLISHSPIESISRASSELSPRQIRTPISSGSKSMLPLSVQPIATIPNIIGRGPSNNSRNLTHPKALHGRDIDTDEQQTPNPSSSYYTSHSTISSTRSPLATSTIPILRHSRHFITSKDTPSRRLPTSKSFRKNHPSSVHSSTASATSIQATAEPSPIEALSQRQETPQKLRKDSDLPAGSNTTLPQPRRSVADLRRSFEKISQPVEPTNELTALGFSFKPSLNNIRQHQNLSSSALRRPPELLIERQSIALNEAPSSRPPLFGKGHIIHVKPRAKAAELFSSQGSIRDSLGHEPSLSSLRGGRSSPQEIPQVGTKDLHGPTKSEPVPRPVGEKMRRESGNNAGLDTSMDGLGGTPFGEQQSDGALAETPKAQYDDSLADTRCRSRPKAHATPLALPPGSRQTQGGAKVSQLRRFFERSSKRFSSPLSLVSLRSRPEPEPKECTGELVRDSPSPSWSEPESLTSTHTIARKISIVPSLTTEISVNDFFCDFVSGQSYESLATASPSGTGAKLEPQAKRESPVKRRIQQFEHLSRDSLKIGTVTEHNGQYKDAGLPSIIKNDSRAGGKRNTIGSWKPIHQKGVAIWRKISNSLSRSLDSWKDCDGDREPINLTEDINSNTSPDHSPSPVKNFGHSLRRPSPFGYSIYRVSHRSRRFASSSNTASSIQLGGGDASNNVPKGTANNGYSRLSPDAPPPPPLRNSLPSIARVSSGFRGPSWFGLDGHFPSKPVQEEDFQPSDVTTPSPSTPQGDPNALLKVMLKQSAEERGRRRQDERNFRRDKTFKALARWKEKCKVDMGYHSADDTDEAGKKQDKGKGKGKEKETVRKEGEEQETETNKKTESGFVIFESKDVKLRHPKPRRPGQVRKLANMYREKGSSGVSVNTKTSSGVTLKESRQSFRQKASSALGFGGRKGNN